MGVATTTDTTDSVCKSFEMLKKLYGMSVQFVETMKKENEEKSAILIKSNKVSPKIMLGFEQLCVVYLVTTPFCNWRWPIAKTDSTQEQNSAPHPAVGAERLADVRNSSAKFGFSSSFSITSTLCVKNGISSKQFGIHSKRSDKVPPTFEPM